MDRTAAMELLGVEEATPRDEVRRRYLSLVRRHHPDVAAGPSDVDVADLTEAYRVLRHDLREHTRPGARDSVAISVDGDTISIPLPPDETFLELLDALATVGAVTYVDPEGGLLEVLLELTSGVRCSLVASLQGRAAHGSTDVFVTLDTESARAVDAASLTREIAQLLDGSLSS